jgi:hypothetical protein
MKQLLGIVPTDPSPVAPAPPPWGLPGPVPNPNLNPDLNLNPGGPCHAGLATPESVKAGVCEGGPCHAVVCEGGPPFDLHPL